MNGQESINTSSKWCNAYSSARGVPGTSVPVNSQGFHCRVWSAKCTWSSFDISALLSQRMPKITSFKERNANCKPTWTDHLSTCLFQTVHFSPQVLPFTSDHLSTCLFQTVHFSSQVLPFTILSTSHLHFSPVHIPTFHDYVFNILGSPLKLGTVNNWTMSEERQVQTLGQKQVEVQIKLPDLSAPFDLPPLRPLFLLSWCSSSIMD